MFLLATIATLVAGAYSSLLRFILDRTFSRLTRLNVFILAMSITFVVFVTGKNRLEDPAFRYRVLNDEYALRKAIAANIRNGSTIEEVRAILGSESGWSQNHALKFCCKQIIEMNLRLRTRRYTTDGCLFAVCGRWNRDIAIPDGILINLDEDWLAKNYSKR